MAGESKAKSTKTCKGNPTSLLQCRHIGVRRFASWDDPDLEQYFEDRKILELDAWLSSFKMQVAKQQGYVCPVCGEHLANGEDLHQHHLVPKKDGGKNVP